MSWYNEDEQCTREEHEKGTGQRTYVSLTVWKIGRVSKSWTESYEARSRTSGCLSYTVKREEFSNMFRF